MKEVNSQKQHRETFKMPRAKLETYVDADLIMRYERYLDDNSMQTSLIVTTQVRRLKEKAEIATERNKKI